MFKPRGEEKRTISGKNNLTIVAYAFIAILLIIGVVWILTMTSRCPVTMKTKLASYYPVDSTFYAELNITPERLKELQAISGNAFTMENLQKSLELASTGGKTDVQDVVKMLEKYQKTFEPIAAFGSLLPVNPEEKEMSALLAIVVKDQKNINQAISELIKEDFTYKDVDYKGTIIKVAENDKPLAYCVFQEKDLLLSNSLDVIKSAIDQSSKRENILSADFSVKILSNLPSNRFLTVILNSSQMLDIPDAGSVAKDNKELLAKIEEVKQFGQAFAHTGIGMSIDKTKLKLITYTPYDLGVIKNKEIRQSLQNVFETSTESFKSSTVLPSDTALFLTFNGLDKYIQTMIQFMSPSEKQAFEQQKMMAKMFTGLDLEKEVIALFSNEFTLAARVENNLLAPVILMTDNTENLPVLNKLFGFITKTVDPTASIADKDVDGNKFSILSSKQLPLPLEYGKVSDLIALSLGNNSIVSLNETVKNLSKSVAGSAEYKALSKGLSKNLNFLAYIDMKKMPEFMKAMGTSEKEINEFKVNFERVDAVLTTLANQNKTAIKFSTLVKFK